MYMYVYMYIYIYVACDIFLPGDSLQCTVYLFDVKTEIRKNLLHIGHTAIYDKLCNSHPTKADSLSIYFSRRV